MRLIFKTGEVTIEFCCDHNPDAVAGALTRALKLLEPAIGVDRRETIDEMSRRASIEDRGLVVPPGRAAFRQTDPFEDLRPPCHATPRATTEGTATDEE